MAASGAQETTPQDRLSSKNSATAETEGIRVEPHTSHERQARPRIEECQDKSDSNERANGGEDGGVETGAAGAAVHTAAPASYEQRLRVRYCFAPGRDAGAEPASVRSDGNDLDRRGDILAALRLV